MKHTKRIVALGLICAVLAAFPVLASEPVRVGVVTLEEVPESWNPLDQRSEAQDEILALTAQPLYRVNDAGQLEPAQAAGMPEDVTGEFAGSYGVPEKARRGYAFAVDIREDAFWEDGKPVSGADWYFTVEKYLEADRFPLEISNYQAFLRGDTKPADQIIGLQEAGFGSVAEAEEAGHSDFYIDVTHFWGLEAGWLRITDRSPLTDTAIPSGCEEMYLTAAYLYWNYLSDGGSQKMFQSEFVGIPASAGEKLSMTDVGLLARENRLLLILEEPAAASYVAAMLSELIPIQSGSDTDRYGTLGSYHSCGPYRIVSAGRDEIGLERNPYWNGAPAEFKILRIRSGK